MKVSKVFLYPGKGGVEILTSFVGVLGAARRTIPYFHIPLNPELVTDLLWSLRQPGTLFAMAVRLIPDRGRALAYLRDRGLPCWIEGQGLEARAVFHSGAKQDLAWALACYGSLDRMRVFVVEEGLVGDLEALLRLPSLEIPYETLLEMSQAIVLFDYDWEYVYVLTRKLPVNQIVNNFRTICYSYGAEAETVLEPRALANIRARIEGMIGLPFLAPSRPRSRVAVG